MNEDQLSFFNLEAPCPDSIIGCETVRAQYKLELDELKSRGACGGCAERSLKNKFIAIINSLTKK